MSARALLHSAGLLAFVCACGAASLGDLAAHVPAWLLWLALGTLPLLVGLRGDAPPDRTLGVVAFWALLIRLPLLLGTDPTLSDDVFRYVWEGRLVGLGFDPFDLAPDAPALATLAVDSPEWAGINHKGLPAIYPPGAQWVFAVIAAIAPTAFAFRVAMVLVDLALIAILGSLQIDVTGLIAGVGIGALAIGFAAQTVIANLISGLFLIFERVFVQGDIIQVGTVTGEVVGIGFRTTQIQTIDGNIVTIPNATLATSEVTNMTTGAQEILLTIEETIDIYADIDHAKRLMVDAIQETSGVVLDDTHQPVIVVTRNGEAWSTTLKLFVTVAKDRWHVTQSTIIETIKRKFDAATILPPVSAIARMRIEAIKAEVKTTRKQELTQE